MIDLQALTRSAQDIEPLPASVARLAALTAGERWTLQAVEEIVRLDQALTLRLLKAANSAASASATPIVTMRDALVRLGIRSLLSLATAAAVQKRMRTALPEYGLNEGELWRHGVAAALAAESLQAYCTASVPAEAYTAALLHDIGKLVMARFLDADVLRLLADAREKGGLSSLCAESELLLAHHGEIGGLVAQHWSLPQRIVTGIIHHHTPDLAHDIVADAVHVANIAAKRAGTGHSALAGDCEGAPSSLERLGMTDADVTALGAHIAVKLEQVLAVHAG